MTYWGAYTGIYTDIQYILDQPDAFQQLTVETFDAVSVKDLQDLQDEVHAVLRRLRDDALRCAESDPERKPGEDCVFNERAYLDPLAFRIRMPIPKIPVDDEACPCRWPVSQDARGAAFDAIINYYVRDPNVTNCRINPVAATCLTNAEIKRWRDRVGKKLLALPDTTTAMLLKKKQAAGIAACTGTEDEATCLSWYNWFEVLESPAYAWIDGSRSGQEADPLVLLKE